MEILKPHLLVGLCGTIAAMAKQEQHVALYRAYRPQSFSEVRGQAHIVDVLKAAIKNKSITHAYLFAGTRGTGKTSVARIFAKELGVSDKDLYEIDAASNRGIDDVRELRDGVHILPFESPYKLYLVDEAHMLTKEAWNALLKTLEEPPSHAIFILATTEAHKVPDTIRSRCDVYFFKQPSRTLIAEVIADIAKSEGYKLEQSAADLVAILAEGSFRDAIGILQKVLTISKDKKVDLEEVERVTAAPPSRIVYALADSIAHNARAEALATVHRAIEQDIDARLLMKLLIQRIRALILMRTAPEVANLMKTEFTEEEFAALEKLAKEGGTHITTNTLRSLLEAYETSAYAVLPHLPLELAIIDATTVGEK